MAETNYGISKWPDSFAHRIHISAWIFIGAGFSAMAIGFIIVGSQAFRAATPSPAKSLRAE